LTGEGVQRQRGPGAFDTGVQAAFAEGRAARHRRRRALRCRPCRAPRCRPRRALGCRPCRAPRCRLRRTPRRRPHKTLHRRPHTTVRGATAAQPDCAARSDCPSTGTSVLWTVYAAAVCAGTTAIAAAASCGVDCTARSDSDCAEQFAQFLGTARAPWGSTCGSSSATGSTRTRSWQRSRMRWTFLRAGGMRGAGVRARHGWECGRVWGGECVACAADDCGGENEHVWFCGCWGGVGVCICVVAYTAVAVLISFIYLYSWNVSRT
jgi:hypothetical protein